MTSSASRLDTMANSQERLSNALALLALLALGFLAPGGDASAPGEAPASGSSKPATVLSEHAGANSGGVVAERKPRSHIHRELPRTQSV